MLASRTAQLFPEACYQVCSPPEPRLLARNGDLQEARPAERRLQRRTSGQAFSGIRAAMRAQSLNALGQAYLLLGKNHVMRIDAPESSNPVALDDYLRAKEELPHMARSLVEGAGREVERVFLGTPAEAYAPCGA
jgi:hypothetical protein